jgi:uncharacterized membrane protein YphA (DoxX/SURF4 family)
MPAITAYFFALLFIYASISKILDFENFQVQLAQSPLLSAFAGFISYSVIIAELIIVVLLCIKITRIIGLYLSLGIMVSFTVYIYLILNYSDFVPCSCGGILEKLGWTEHLIFNIVCVLFAFVGIYILQQQRERKLYKSIIAASALSFLSAGVIICMFLFSENIIKSENNFTRRFLLYPVFEDKTLKLDNPYYYFAGSDDDHIYLGNKSTPQDFVTVDTSFSRNVKMKIIPDNLTHSFRNIQLQVKAPYYYMYDGTVPVIYRGIVGKPEAETISFGDAYFTQLVVQDSTRFALRTQDGKSKEVTIAGLNLDGNPKIALYPSVLEKQSDGVFDVDGRLIPDLNTSKLIYSYAYRNQFIIIGNDLSVQHRLNTIDTTHTAQIKIVRLSDGRHKMAAPPMKVNINATANRDVLFNQSDLIGKHESRSAWKKSKVIDIYRTDLQEYIGSFYLYNKQGQVVSDFWATDKYFYVLQGNELSRYYYRNPIKKYFKTGEAENLKKSRH